MNVRFYRDRNDYIMIDVTAVKRVRISTGLKVREADWNKKKQRPKVPGPVTTKLDNIEKQIYERHAVTPAEIQRVIKGYDHSWQSALDEFLIWLTDEKKPNTVKKFKTMQTFLLSCGFAPQVWSGFDLSFFDKYKNWLRSDREVFTERGIRKLSGNKDNAVSKNVKAVVRFLKWAKKRKYHRVDLEDIELPKERPAGVVRLTWDELVQLNEFNDLPPGMKKDKDWFVIQCLTGPRISDMNNLNKWKIRGDELRLETVKTKEPVIIPLVSFARDLVPKCLKDLRKSRTNQPLNRNLKEIFRRAGIDSPVVKTVHSGGRSEEFVYEKWEKASTHVARKTFANLMYEKGMRVDNIAVIMGISEKTLRAHYLEIRKTEAANEMREKWR